MTEENLYKGPIITIDEEVLKGSKLTLEEIDEILKGLRTILGEDNFPKIFPNVDNLYIGSTPTLEYIISLYKNLKKLENCQGFESHISLYNNEEQFKHNYFVAYLAGFLLSEVDDIILEPDYDKSSKDKSPKGDICLKLNGVEIYIECKTINTKQFNFLNKHIDAIRLSKKYENIGQRPITIFFKTETSFSMDCIEKLYKELNNKISKITSTKNTEVIKDNENFKVIIYGNAGETEDVIHINDSKFKLPSTIGENESFSFHIGHKKENDIVYCESLLFDENENCWYPGTILIGKPICIGGPKVDIKKILFELIRKGRKKKIPDKPYILAIGMENVLGGNEDNKRTLESFFKRYNKRYSGVLLFDNKDSKRFNLKLIKNQSAKNPIPIDLCNILIKINNKYG